MSRRSRVRLGWVFCAAFALACVSFEVPPFQWEPAPAPPAADAPPLLGRAPCAERFPERAAWFGDLHVHTGYSMDARTRDLVLRPDDAYRYASGEAVSLPPLDAAGEGTRRVRIDRPLDFAAVTDHAEWIGEVSLCVDPESDAYDTRSCRVYRGEDQFWWARMLGLGGMGLRIAGVARGGRTPSCVERTHRCAARARSRCGRTRRLPRSAGTTEALRVASRPSTRGSTAIRRHSARFTAT